MSMSLAEFRRGLEPWLTRDPFIRPFVCDGSPLDCRVFLVGFNAARRLTKPFADYWSDSYGFIETNFLEDYLREKGRATPTHTRAHIKKFVQAAAPLKCLETNIHASPSASKGKLADKSTELFEFLFETIQPAIVVAYSKDPLVFFMNATGRKDFIDQFQQVKWKKHQFQLYGVERHFRSFGFENAKNLGGKVATHFAQSIRT